MSTDVVADAIAVLGVLVAAVGLIVAARANKTAKDANRVAKVANDLATAGLAEAEEANRVAVEGNEIARDANQVAERALAATTDHVTYSWRLEAQEDGVTVALLNDSAHAAHQVTVVIDQDSHVKTTASADEVEPFGQVLLDLEDLVQQEIEEERRKAQRRDAINNADNGVLVFGEPHHRFRLRLTVTARTQAGVQHSDVIEQVLTVRDGKLKTPRRR